jgi:FkbM family methyltransferase
MIFGSRVRSIARKFCRRMIFKRRLPADFGGHRLYVTPECGLYYFKVNLEAVNSELFAFARKFVSEGTSVWDLGANLGVFAFAAAGLAKKAGFVLAVEPDAWLVNLMHRSSRIIPQAHAPVQVLPAAISDRLGVGRFYIPEGGRASSYLNVPAGYSRTGTVREIHQVVQVSVDWLSQQFPAPQVIKIDVEGEEVNLLKGALKTLAEHHPVLLMEVWEKNSDTVTHILHGLGYELFNSARGFERQEPIQRATWSTLALAKS